MDDVLEFLKQYLSTLIGTPFQIKRVEVGTLEEAYNGLMSPNDFPAILIEPDGEPRREPSPWSNHIKKVYAITFYVFFRHRTPNVSRMAQPNINNQGTLISNVTDEMNRLLGLNKKLDGAVRQWTDKWEITPATDENGNQVRIVRTEWTDDLVKWCGEENNQS